MDDKQIISFKISKEILNEIKKLSAERECSVSATLRYIITKYFEKN